jgi:hypothetical protein
MTKGTIIRTALAIAVSIHTALIATDVTGFENPTVDLIYKIISIAVNFVVVALTTYYNQDFTPEACQGTGLTRQLKAEKKAGYIGEKFGEGCDGDE